MSETVTSTPEFYGGMPILAKRVFATLIVAELLAIDVGGMVAARKFDLQQEAQAAQAKGANLSTTAPVLSAVNVLLVKDSAKTSMLPEAAIEESTRIAGDILSLSSAGALRLGETSVETLLVKPKGVVKEGGKLKTCFTAKQIDSMHTKRFTQAEHDAAAVKQAQNMIMLGGSPTCSLYEGAGAYATSSQSPYTVYNLTGIGATPTNEEALSNLASVELHEFGHVLGLGHAFVFSCRKDGTWQFSDDSIQQQVKDGCTTEKNKDGTVNEYASRQTVMGSAYGADISGGVSPYSPVEMAKLNPAFKIETVAPVPGKYRLTVAPGQMLGIRFALPENHALKKVIPGADAVIFALNDGGAAGRGTAGASDMRTLDDPSKDYNLGTFVTSSENGNVTTIQTRLNSYMGSLQAMYDTVSWWKNDPLYSSMLKLSDALGEPKTFDMSYGVPLYIDDQLGIAVYSGIDKDGYYADVRSVLSQAERASKVPSMR